MRPLFLWTESSVRSTFAVVQSAYPGEFFIYVDDKEPTAERLENLKVFIRSERTDVSRRNKQRYTADEVRVFLIASLEIL